MKLLVVLLGLLAIASATRLKTTTEKTSQDWTDVDQSQWQSGDVGDSLSWGIQHVLEAAVREGKVNNTNFMITQINSVQQQVVGRAVNYKYNVVLSNHEGSTFTTTFTVNFVTFSGLRTLTHYNYTVRTIYSISQPEPTATGDWQEIDLSELHNDDLADSMDWAISTVYNSGVAAGKIKDDDYKIVATALWEQSMTVGNNYRGQIELNNGKTISVYISFTLYLSPEGKRTLTHSTYKVIGSIPAPTPTHRHRH